MYFLSGSDTCSNLIPVLSVISTNWGMGRSLQTTFFAPGGAGVPTAWACEKALFAASTVSKRATPVRSRTRIPIDRQINFPLSQANSEARSPPAAHSYRSTTAAPLDESQRDW